MGAPALYFWQYKVLIRQDGIRTKPLQTDTSGEHLDVFSKFFLGGCSTAQQKKKWQTLSYNRMCQIVPPSSLPGASMRDEAERKRKGTESRPPFPSPQAGHSHPPSLFLSCGQCMRQWQKLRGQNTMRHPPTIRVFSFGIIFLYAKNLLGHPTSLWVHEKTDKRVWEMHFFSLFCSLPLSSHLWQE